MAAAHSLIRGIPTLTLFSIKTSVVDGCLETRSTQGETALLSEDGVSNSKLGSRPNRQGERFRRISHRSLAPCREIEWKVPFERNIKGGIGGNKEPGIDFHNGYL